ncbi:MAG: hypothetical protein WBW84_11005 [Acidobacteriaceae bacterium]
MASPQRPLPKQPRRDNPPVLETFETGRARREISSGWRFGFWWVWILIIAGIWYVGFGWGTSGGWIWGHRQAVQTADDTALAGPGVAILDANNKLPFVGQGFQIQNVPVERDAGPRSYWIGSQFNSVPMLVVNASNMANPRGSSRDAAAGHKSAPAAAAGNPPNAAANAAGSPDRTANNSRSAAAIPATAPDEWLDVTGQILKAPPAGQAEQQWGLSTGDTDRLEGEGVYINATEMQTVAH